MTVAGRPSAMNASASRMPSSVLPVAVGARDDDRAVGRSPSAHTARRCRSRTSSRRSTLRHRTLRSRINFGAHTANMAEDGLPGERHIAYYRERALGGAGMIVVEPVPVHRTAVLTRGNFRHDDDASCPHFRTLTDALPRGRTPATS